MKYIIINDIHYLWQNKKKLILMYLLIYISYFLLGIMINGYGESEYFMNNVFGFHFYFPEFYQDILKASFLLLNYSFYLYLNLSLLIKDMDNFDYLFSRIKVSKWISIKLIPCFLIAFILNTILFLIGLLFGTIDFSFYFVIIKKIIVILITTMCLYILFMLNQKTKLLFWGLCFLFLSTLLFIPINLIKTKLIVFLGIWIFIKVILFVIGSFIKFSDLKA